MTMMTTSCELMGLNLVRGNNQMCIAHHTENREACHHIFYHTSVDIIHIILAVLHIATEIISW